MFHWCDSAIILVGGCKTRENVVKLIKKESFNSRAIFWNQDFSPQRENSVLSRESKKMSTLPPWHDSLPFSS